MTVHLGVETADRDASRLTMDRKGEQEQLDLVVARLSIKFHQLPGHVVASAVREAEIGLRSASIREFVPVLVEKQARDWLAAQLTPVTVAES